MQRKGFEGHMAAACGALGKQIPYAIAAALCALDSAEEGLADAELARIGSAARSLPVTPQPQPVAAAPQAPAAAAPAPAAPSGPSKDEMERLVGQVAGALSGKTDTATARSLAQQAGLSAAWVESIPGLIAAQGWPGSLYAAYTARKERQEPRAVAIAAAVEAAYQ